MSNLEEIRRPGVKFRKTNELNVNCGEECEFGVKI
uniref:Uncharacterized protein n=1 Tax=Arundo donax TaxID=35708 RepID=A0A0A9FYH3_ARUDO